MPVRGKTDFFLVILFFIYFASLNRSKDSSATTWINGRLQPQIKESVTKQQLIKPKKTISIS
jgi:uncharacterized sodium:solute symporter family permease YidK